MAVPGVLTPTGEFIPTAGGTPPAIGPGPVVVGGGGGITPGVLLVTDAQPQYDSRGRLRRDPRLRPRSRSRSRSPERYDQGPPPPYAGGNVTNVGKVDNRQLNLSNKSSYALNIGGRGRSKSKDKKKKDGRSPSRSHSRSRSGHRSGKRSSSRSGRRSGKKPSSRSRSRSGSRSGRRRSGKKSSSRGSKKSKASAAVAAVAPASNTGEPIGNLIVVPGRHVPYWRRFGWPRRRFYRRHRHPYVFLGDALVGAQHLPSVHSDRMFKVIHEKYLSFRKNDNRPRAFLKALDAVTEEYTDISNPTESFSVHRQLLKGKNLTLTFEYGKNKVNLRGRVYPLLSQDHVRAVFVPSSKASPILLNNEDNISLKLADFSHDDIFVNPNTSSKLTHLPISLYNEREHALYRKYNIPTPHAVLDVVPSGSKNAPFRLTSLSIFLDMRPPKVSRTHIGIPGYPALERSVDFAQTSAVSSYVQDSPKIAAAFHEAIAAKVAPAVLISKSQSFVPDPDEYVHLGHLTGTVVSYAVVKLVTASKTLHALDDPKFLRKQLSVDAIGKKAVEHITKLSNAMVHVDDTTAADGSGDNFPTLRQLLTHTSGLPEGVHITCEDVMAMYESATATIKDPVKLNKPLPAPSAGVLSPTSDPYLVAEQGFVDSLAMLTPSTNPSNSGFGQWANSTEAALVAMFLRRFVSLAKTAEEIITEVFMNINRAINFVWNVTRDGNDSIITLGPGNPYSLVECASIDRAGFVAYINQMAGELASVNKSTSPLAIMLANPLKTRGDIESHYMGWHTSNDTPLQIIYCGNTSAVQSVLAFFIPMFDFWGVVIADATTTAEPVVGHGVLLDAMIEGVDEVKDLPKIPLTIASRDSGTLANAPYVPPVDYSTVMLPETTTYISPFMDPTATFFPTLTLDLFEDDNQLILATITNPAAKGKPLSQFFMAYDARNKAYMVVREDGTLGGTVSITPKAIYLPLQGIFFEASQHAALIKPYVDAVSGLSSKTSIDTRTDTATEELLRQIKRPVAPIKLLRSSPTTGASSSSSEPQRIEAGFGWGLAAGGLAGLAAGGLLASRPVYVAPTPAYYHPYGYGYRRRYYRPPVVIADSIADTSVGVIYVEPPPTYDEFGNVIVLQPSFGYGWGGYYGGPFLGGGRHLGWRGPREPRHHRRHGHRGGGGGGRRGRR